MFKLLKSFKNVKEQQLFLLYLADNYRKGNKEKNEGSYTKKNKAKKIKSDNFTGSNKERSNIVF